MNAQIFHRCRPISILKLLGFIVATLLCLWFNGWSIDRERQSKWRVWNSQSIDVSGMVLIPAGEFLMGNPGNNSDESPLNKVFLGAYYIDSYEVSVADYQACYESDGCLQPETGGFFNWGVSDKMNHPINGVSWYNAKAYCRFANKRLPTEAEWEKAATWKHNRKFTYPSGNQSVSCQDAIMNDKQHGCGKAGTWPVGSKPREINGTYDMAGNVWEWVEDWYGLYPGGYSAHPQGPSAGTNKVLRGGSWRSIASYLHGTYRYNHLPSDRGYSMGFRCAYTLP